MVQLNKLFYLFMITLYGSSSLYAFSKYDSLIQKLATAPEKFFDNRDALQQSIRKKITVDIYVGAQTLFVEWDEAAKTIADVKVYRDRELLYTIKRKAAQIGHRYNYAVVRDLQPAHRYRFRLLFTMQNGKKEEVDFTIRTADKRGKSKPRTFRLYDDIEGGSGDKERVLKKLTKEGTMRSFGLQNSAMYWVEDFYRPKPNLDNSALRLRSAPDTTLLKGLIRRDLHNSTPHERIDTEKGIVVLDIELVPSVLEYVTREYSPYGAFVSKFLESQKVRENGKRIVLDAIRKKLIAIRTVKRVLSDTPVGLWNSVVLWNRYNDNSKNRDDIALSKGSRCNWRICYDEWHRNDALIYKPLIDIVDYVMPVAYPMFDLRSAEGRRRQLGYMVSKFTELRRINPDVVIIPSISPHYTEGWTYQAGLQHKAVSRETFSWYLETLYMMYEEGLIDSVHIWADNDGTTFAGFVKEGWWQALLAFTKKYGLRR